MSDVRLISILFRGFIVWLLIIALESIHGIVRTLFVEPAIGGHRARQISVVIASLLVLAISFVFTRWLKASFVSVFILVGVMWVALTVGFELLLGKLALGLSWERIGSDYDIARGGLMPIGLLIILLGPVAMAKLLDEV